MSIIYRQGYPTTREHYYQYFNPTREVADCAKQIQLINIFRNLWEQHGLWTRSLIISKAANLGDEEAVTKRLLRNPRDMAEQIRPFFGANAAQQFQSLFEQHLIIAAKLVDAAKAGNSYLVNQLRKDWYQNADQIAHLLATLSPFWNEEEWRKMLYEHLRLIEEEATLRLTGKFAEDVALYDTIEMQGLEMADMMSNALISLLNIR